MSKPSIAPDSDSTAAAEGERVPAVGAGQGPAWSDQRVEQQILEETRAFVTDVETVLESWFDEQRQFARGIAAASEPVVESIARLSTGGKRMRAQLLYWAWRAAGGAADSPVPRAAAAGLELFQTAALVHDDIIDRSATRRGMPSVHEGFRALHRDNGWSHDPMHFGVSAAVLTGDLALSWSEQLFHRAVAEAGHPAGALEDFTAMRTEVMLGQYLDVHAEVAASTLPAEQAIERAFEVIRYKSAKYSAEHPAALGALLAGAEPSFVQSCRDLALPLGEAFQIRDDILGVFGDPEATGKPAGDDLREGKRTVLVGLHLRAARREDADLVSEALGDQSLGDAEVEALRDALRRSGALAETERVVDGLSERVRAGLDALPARPVPRAALTRLARALISRAS